MLKKITLILTLLPNICFGLTQCPRGDCEVPIEYMVTMYALFYAKTQECSKIDPKNSERYADGFIHMMTDGDGGQEALEKIKKYPNLEEILRAAGESERPKRGLANDCPAILRYSKIPEK